MQGNDDLSFNVALPVPIASYYENGDVPEAKAAGWYLEVVPTEDEAFMMAGLHQPAPEEAADKTLHSRS